ncbi:putative secondary metabolism biosynthetic enzyme, partial [Claviceps maximensis]
MAQMQTCLVQPTEGQDEPMIKKNHPMPTISEPFQVLIRVLAVALNPSDFRMPSYHPVPGAVLGCDFVGTVLEAGCEAVAWAPGTRLCGAIHGSNPADPSNGAFAEYLVADARLLLRVPDTWSDLEGAALGGAGWATVALAMENSLKLTGCPSSPAPPRTDGSRVPVLVYGGATATGTMACQILTKSGYNAIAIASSASSTLVKEFGATSVFAYTSPTWAETVRKATDGSLKHVIDCITSPETISCCFTTLARAGARYASLDYAPPEWRTRKSVNVDMPLAYAIWGKEIKLRDLYYRKADPTKLELGIRWRHEIQMLLDKGQIKCHPVREVLGRWNGIIQGLNMLKAKQVRGQKLVVRIAGTALAE